MRLTLRAVTLTSALAMAVASLPAFADETLDAVKDSGVFKVGIKVDYKPFGFRDDSGTTVGFEHDLVEALGVRLTEKLGRPVTVEKVTVTAQNRIPFLEQGKIDLIAATMNDNEERRKQMDIVDPGYYASGALIIARKERKVTKWEDLSGKTVCALQGSFYIKPLAQQYNIEFAPYAGIAEMNQALLDDRCYAEIGDSVLIGMQLQEDKWADYEAPLAPAFETPFVMAVRKNQPDIRAVVSEMLTEWHKSGKLLETEKKWKLRPNAWLADQHKKAGG